MPSSSSEYESSDALAGEVQDEAEADHYPEAAELSDGMEQFSRPDSVETCITEQSGENIITCTEDMQAEQAAVHIAGAAELFEIFDGSDPCLEVLQDQIAFLEVKLALL